ncbi:MAG: cupin domain-containing protein [Candidatus Latescibacteria bacterium]|jgi:ethanolamine utilization protein EutQ|nr:cupin domain-containing protein [Candidatus Latescibacterota bacterium]
MIRVVTKADRDLRPIELPGASVQVSDPIIGQQDCLSAGFTEYDAPSRLEWTFDYNEVFYLLEGSLEIQEGDSEPITFGVGDLGYIEKGSHVFITVPERAYLLHVTQPAWRD